MKDGCDFVSLNKVLVPFWLLIPFLNCCWWQWLVSGLYLFVHYPFSPDRQLLYFFSPCPSLSLPLSDTTLLFSSSPVPPAPRDHERQSGPCIEDFRITGRRFSGAPGSPWSRSVLPTAHNVDIWNQRSSTTSNQAQSSKFSTQVVWLS